MPVRTLSQAEATELENLLVAEDYALCEKSFKHFVRRAWPIIEKGKAFKDNWHIDVICAHLEACYRREIKRLIINVPYRSMKSTICSVMFPVWVWLQNPTQDLLTGSHNIRLSTRDSVKSRTILESNWFKYKWRNHVRFTSDQNQKSRYKNTQFGERLVFGTKSGISGENADFIIIDDAHDAESAMFSKVERLSVLEKFDQEVSNRLNDENGVIIIIMQRLHEMDLTGHCLKDNEDPENDQLWVHLRLPFKYEAKCPCVTPLGEVDPRTEEGELYWPSRFSEGYYKEAERRLRAFGVAAQLQQRPVPMGGGMINIDNFRRYKILPSLDQWIEVVQFWDTAQKADELTNAPWVCMTIVHTDKGYFVKDIYREWMTYPNGKRAVINLAERERPNAIVIEDRSTGQSLLQELPYECAFTFLPYDPCGKGDKVTRFGVESVAIEAGKVWLPETATWLPDYESEIIHFPVSEYMDQADVTSMMLRWFKDRLGEIKVTWV